MFAIGSRLTVTFLAGYPFAQVFAPPASDFVCFEPMTAPTNALRSGVGLRLVEAGNAFAAAFSIAVG
jgi:aldose 1-epimerase